ncbi:MAG TPA: hypothetical protein VH371_06775 [Candidatus Limnocylindrales bacterium]|jgi:hypothetical protein
MSRPLLLVAGVLCLIGLVWIGQGSGAIGGSAMTGSSFWLAVGAVLVVTGLGLVAFAWARRPKPGA